MKILVVGTGYVGLVTGTCLAEMGHKVTCLDINEKRIETLKNGQIPIYEPGLKEIVSRNVLADRLYFSTNYQSCVSDAQIIFIAVDTPLQSDGSADTSQVKSVATSLGKYMIQDSTVVSKSTVPVGTTSEVGNIIRQSLKNRGLSLQIDLVSNPEFLKEGNAIQDFMKPDRIIIGTENERAKQTMREVYKPFMLNHERFIFMDIFSAELSKYAANAMLATRISFMNELSQLCEKLGADIFHVRQAIGSDKRIGSQFLYPGVGYGGSCLPKDVKALVSQAKAVNIDLNVLTQVDLVNKRQKELLNHKITSYFKGQELLKGKTIGVLGLSFKPDTDDMREAPSIELINYLAESECIIKVFDPIAMEKAKLLLTHKHIQWCKDEELVAKDADALVLMTEWKQFRLLNMPAILQKMRGRAFFDGRNQYEPKEMEKYGFDYFGIGR